MVLYNSYIIIASLIIVIIHSIATSVWGLHWFPYPKGEKPKNPVRPWSWEYIIRPTEIYNRENGESLGKVDILKGFGKSLLAYVALVLCGFVILIILSLICSLSPVVVFGIYILYFSFVSVLVFPDIYLRLTNLPGRLSEGKGDAPFSPMLLGFAVTYLAIPIILSRVDGISCSHFLVRLDTALWLCGLIAALAVAATGIFLFTVGKPAPFRTFGCFAYSWLLYGFGSLLLLSLYKEPATATSLF